MAGPAPSRVPTVKDALEKEGRRGGEVAGPQGMLESLGAARGGSRVRCFL